MKKKSFFARFFSAEPAGQVDCVDDFKKDFSGIEGVKSVDLDEHEQSLKIKVDPNRKSEHYSKELQKVATKHSTHFKVSGCRICGAASGLNSCYLEKQLEHFGNLKNFTVAKDGWIRIPLLRSFFENKAGPVTPAAPKEEKESKKYLLALILTLINAGFGLAAWLSTLFFTLPALTIPLWVVSFLAGGYFGTLEAVRSLLEKKLNIDFVMILAALGAALLNNPEDGAILLFLFSLSNTLQAYALDRSRKSISKLLKIRPTTANVRRGGQVFEIKVDHLELGDIVLVRPGEAVPIDAKVVEGVSEINQANITGESLPVLKKVGDVVLGGTFNTTGYLEIEVTRLSKDSTLSKIILLVEDAWNNKAGTQRWLEKYEGIYTSFVILGTMVALGVPYFFYQANLYDAAYKAINFLVVASPCALVISIPATIISAIANAARNGLLFKGGGALEASSGIKVLALDKTGTITEGSPAVNQVISFVGSEEQLLREIFPIEKKSEHLIAKAITLYSQKYSPDNRSVTEFHAIYGMGVAGGCESSRYLIGNAALMQKFAVHLTPEVEEHSKRLLQEAQTVIYVYRFNRQSGTDQSLESFAANQDGQFLGLITLSDPLRPEAKVMIEDLKQRSGFEKIVLLTGDNFAVAKQVAAQVGIDEFYADLLPQNKTEIIQSLQKKYGKVAMLGDGVNDAPSLVTADLGIAMGDAGTDIAIDAADVVLMNGNLKSISHLFGLARRSRTVVLQNLVFSALVVVFLITYNYFFTLALPLGVLGHEGSTVLVIFNGMRLLFFSE